MVQPAQEEDLQADSLHAPRIQIPTSFQVSRLPGSSMRATIRPIRHHELCVRLVETYMRSRQQHSMMRGRRGGSVAP